MTNKVSFDASVSAKWVLDEPMSGAARELLNGCARDDIEITVPPLWEYELDSIIRNHVYRGEITQDRAREVRAVLLDAPATVKHLPLIRIRAYGIAAEANQRRVYDSIYAAHAEAEECVLWTADYEYHSAVRGFLSHVKYLGDVEPPPNENTAS